MLGRVKKLPLLLPILLALVSLAVAFLVNGLRPFGLDLLLPLSAFVPLLLYMLICTGLAEYCRKQGVSKLGDLIGGLQLPGDKPKEPRPTPYE